MNYQDMKKIYIKPQSAIYTLEAATMLAGSLDGKQVNMAWIATLNTMVMLRSLTNVKTLSGTIAC